MLDWLINQRLALSVSLSVCLSLALSLCAFSLFSVSSFSSSSRLCMSLTYSLYLFIYLSICLSAYLSFCLLSVIYLSSHLSLSPTLSYFSLIYLFILSFFSLTSFLSAPSPSPLTICLLSPLPPHSLWGRPIMEMLLAPASWQQQRSVLPTADADDDEKVEADPFGLHQHVSRYQLHKNPHFHFSALLCSSL